LVAEFNNEGGEIGELLKLLKFKYSVKKEGDGEYSILERHLDGAEMFLEKGNDVKKALFFAAVQDKKLYRKLKCSIGIQAEFKIDYNPNSQEPVLVGAIYPNGLYAGTIRKKTKKFVIENKIKAASPLSEILGMKDSGSMLSRSYSHKFDLIYNLNNL
jgi:hypothetical protein